MKWYEMTKGDNWKKWATSKESKLKERILKGIPDGMRAVAWDKMTEASSQREKNPGKYQECLNGDSKMVDQIDLDIMRAYRDHVQFYQRYGHGQVKLFNILKAYSRKDTVVGYCQGMADMTAFLLMYIPDEEQAFWMLNQLLNSPKYEMHGNFENGFPKVNETIFVYETLLQKKFPKLKKHLDENGIDTRIYALKWFMLFFLENLPFGIVLRVWDCFLYFGYYLVYSFALTLMRHYEDRLLKCRDIEQIMVAIKFKDINLTPDEFIELSMKNKVTEKEVRQLEKNIKPH